MPIEHKLQPTFSGGEFAPSLAGRVDLSKYSTGAKTLKNFLVHPHGGTSNRPGTLYVASVKDSTKKARTVAFEFSTVQAYIIEVGAGYFRFYKGGGQIQKSSADGWLTSTGYVKGDWVSLSSVLYYCLVAHTSGTFATDLAAGKWVAQTVYEVPNSYAEGDLPHLKFAQSADVLYICHSSYAPAQLVRFAHDDWELDDYVFKSGPFMLTNTTDTTLHTSAVTGSGVTLTASVATFFSSHVGSLWRLVQDIAGSVVTKAFTSATTSTSIACGSTWRIITHGTWTASVRVEQSLDGGSTWTELRSFSGANDFNANTSGEVDVPCLIRLNCYAYTSGTLNIDLTSDPFTQTGIVKITAYSSATAVTVTVIDNLGSTAVTKEWAEGAWSTYRGWPACCAFFQDRLAFADSTTQPQTIWFTEVGNYASYKRSDPLVDSDGITVNLPSRKMNAIRSMLPLGQILALTSASEWAVGPSADGVLAPTSINTGIQGYRGCNFAEPVIIGNRVIYVTPQGQVVRDLGYDYTNAGFTGADISIISNHLFTNYQILELAYQQEPDSLVWAVRDDGTLLSLTYLREQEVIAWTRHETDGEVESIAVIPGAVYDELWMIVKRGSDRFVEKMVPRLTSTDPRDQFFVDAGISYYDPITITGATKANPVVVTAPAHGLSNGDVVDIRNVVGMTELNGRRFIVASKTTDTFHLTDEQTGANINGTAYTTYVSDGEVNFVTDTIDGLGHLNGRSVIVLADGNVQGPYTVSGGEITLDPPAGIAHIGLPYTADLETLNLELALQDGTAQGRKIHVPQVTLRFLNSRGGFLGPSSDKLYEIVQRKGEPLGSPIALFTGDYKQAITPAFDKGGRIFYRQSDPLPVTILGVIPRVEMGG
jgi:hypothetical protein